MAKLSAHGYELARLVKVRPDLDDNADPARPGILGTAEHKDFLSIRSDGWILNRYTFRWMDTKRINDSGWKLRQRIKRDRREGTALLHATLRLVAVYVAKGYVVESEHAALGIERKGLAPATGAEDSGS